MRTGCAAAVSELDQDGERLSVEYRTLTNDLAEGCRRAIRARTGLDPDLVVLLEAGTLPRTSSGTRRAETLRAWRHGELYPP